MNTKQLIVVTLGSALLFAPALAQARQDQNQAQSQESVADAARKAQAEKKTAQKSKMVIDNDNLDYPKGDSQRRRPGTRPGGGPDQGCGR